MTNIQDIIQISEFKRNTKVFLDEARKGPLLVRRGYEIFELKLVPVTVQIAEGVTTDPRMALPSTLEEANDPQSLGYSAVVRPDTLTGLLVGEGADSTEPVRVTPENWGA